ncbi:MAG: beta-galactosidase [Clostridia bacterium]|nr:beta-galactosidase [Clostridia bacterium]
MVNYDKLYIGTNYHPHDWTPERWRVDIAMMKEAGFELVRLGHLMWDSFEPEDGIYTFDWFDEVMDLFAEAGIGVVLDISLRPAPIWVHEKAPGCSIHDKAGHSCAAVRRYMEDVTDPDYQRYAFRFARALIARYQHHPALFCFGLCNEQGAGWMSFSEGSLSHFQRWLKNKYDSIEALNKAWSTQRWCRRLRSFEDVLFPETTIARGAPEPWLDMRRFFSDGIGEFLVQLSQLVEECAPGVPHSSNHYSGHKNIGFDLLKYTDGFVDYPGVGHYPDYVMNEQVQYTFTTIQERLNEQEKPMWFLEFISGANSIYSGPEGYVRMQAFLCLQHRLQMLLGWTWRTMLGGEEQFYNGLLGHDAVPNPVYFEYAQIAKDFRKLEKYAFPYLPHPEIAVAFHQDSLWAAEYSTTHFALPYTQAILYAQKALFYQNRDYNMVNLRNLKKKYKLLIVPEQIIMDPVSAQTIRNYVLEGGSVLMTGYSATLDETGKVFDTPRPGLLSDVFGIRVAGFDRAGRPDCAGDIQPANRTITRGSESLSFHADYVERIELQDATTFAALENGQCCVSVHFFGKGKAYYLAPESNAELLSWMIDQLSEELELSAPPTAPEGVQARQIAPDQIFYVNTTNRAKKVSLPSAAYGVLSEKEYQTEFLLAPYDGELLITHSAENHAGSQT